MDEDRLINLLRNQREFKFERALDKDKLPYFVVSLDNPSTRISGCRSVSEALRMAMEEFENYGTEQW